MVEKIRELCKKKGISVSKLERETGLGNGIIGKWEKFGREPKFVHIKAIADYFNVPISYLTGEDQTIVDRIRALCRQNKTSITKIEEELGYANGTIGKWAKTKRKPQLEKVIEIAKRLGVSTEYLLTGEEQKEKPPARGGELTGLRKEAWNLIEAMDDDTLRKFIKAAKAMLED